MIKSVNAFGESDCNTAVKTNRKYKDSLFAALFKDGDNLAKLYAQLHPEAVFDKNSIKVVTLDNVFTNGIYNDLAFSVDGRLIVMMEHQSTVNPNMPLRMLMYIAEEYKRVADVSPTSLYSKSLIKVPTPEFYVVYTGNEEYPSELILSDAFRAQGSALPLELKVKVIKNAPDYTILGDFIQFIRLVQDYIANGTNRNIAIQLAMQSYRQGFTISNFLKRGDAVNIMMEQMSWEETLTKLEEHMRAEARAEAHAEGRAEGQEEIIEKAINNFHKTGASRIYIKEHLVSILGLDNDTAEDYLTKYFDK